MGDSLPSVALLLNDLAHTLSQRMCEWWQSCLHSHLDSLKRTERNIGKELRTGTGSQENHGLVGIWKVLVAIQVLEDLVETVLSTTLETVTDECRRPSEEYSTKSLSLVDALPSANVGLVEGGVDLTSAFYKIKRGNGCVGWPTSYRRDCQ